LAAAGVRHAVRMAQVSLQELQRFMKILRDMISRVVE
jgi:hypothetical protein